MFGVENEFKTLFVKNHQFIFEAKLHAMRHFLSITKISSAQSNVAHLQFTTLQFSFLH